MSGNFAIKGGGGGRTPNGKCHLKFPFWLFETFPKVKILLYCNHENGGCTLYLIVVNLGQVASREKEKQREDEQMVVHT